MVFLDMATVAIELARAVAQRAEQQFAPQGARAGF
jgi:hypothetical protein